MSSLEVEGMLRAAIVCRHCFKVEIVEHVEGRDPQLIFANHGWHLGGHYRQIRCGGHCAYKPDRYELANVGPTLHAKLDQLPPGRFKLEEWLNWRSPIDSIES